MNKNATFREIERKLAENLEQLDARQRTNELRVQREFSDELQALMKSYRVSASDVVAILESRA